MSDLDIVLKVRTDDNAEQVVVRTLESIRQAAETQGRKIGESTAKGVGSSLNSSSTKKYIEENLISSVKSATGQAKNSLQNIFNDIFKVESAVKSFDTKRTIESALINPVKQLKGEARKSYQDLVNEMFGAVQIDSIVKSANTKRVIEETLINPVKQLKGEARKSYQDLVNEMFGAVPEKQKTLMEKMVEGDEKAVRKMAALHDEALRMNDKLQKEASKTVFERAGIQSPEDTKARISALKEAKAAWESAGTSAEGYKGAIAKINSELNVLEFGNARARGSLHKFAAAMASATFEITGAVYGITALGTALAGPAIFGGKFLKSIEDAQHGIAAILGSMASASGLQTTYAQNSAIAATQIEGLADAATKYNVSLEEVVKTYRAIAGPAMAAGFSMEQVAKIATLGTVATATLGLSAQQTVQETRDLFGGIQAASSTLATALGLKDKDINEAKQSAEGLFKFLERKLEGFSIAAVERQNTLTGAFDILTNKLQRLLSDQQIFEGVKNTINEISNSIATFDKETGKFAFSDSALKTANDYLAMLKGIGATAKLVGTSIGTVIEISSSMGHAPIAALAAYSIYTRKAMVETGLLAAEMNLATASANKMAIAMTGLGTFLLGFTFGSVLYEQFEIARKAGVVFFSATVRLLETAKYGFNELGAAIGLASDILGGKGLATSWDTYQQTRLKIKSAHNEQVDFINSYYTEAMKEAETYGKKSVKVVADSSEIEKNIRAAQAKKEIGILLDKVKDEEKIREDYQKKVANATVLYGSRTSVLNYDNPEDVKAREVALKEYNRILKDAAEERDKALKALNKVDASAARQARDLFQDSRNQYKEFQNELQSDVANGSKSFVDVYTESIDYIEKNIAPVAQKLAKTVGMKAPLSEIGVMRSEALKKFSEDTKKASDEIEKVNAEFAKSLMPESEKILVEFESSYGKLSNATKLGIQSLEKALDSGPLDEASIKALNALYRLQNGIDKLELATKFKSQSAKIKESFDLIQKSMDINRLQTDLQVEREGGGAMAQLRGEYEKFSILQQEVSEAQKAYTDQSNLLSEAEQRKKDKVEGAAEAVEYLTKVVEEAKKALVSKEVEMAKYQNATDRTFGKGFRGAAEEYVANVQNMSKVGSEVFGKAMQTMEDAIVSFIKTGKFSFKGFVDYIKDLLLKLAAQKFVVNVLGAVGLGGVSGAAMAQWASEQGIIGGIQNILGLSGGPSFGTALGNIGSSFSTFATMLGEGAGIIESASAALAGTASSFAAIAGPIGLGITAATMLSSVFGSKGAPKSMIGGGGRISAGQATLDPTGLQRWTDYTSQSSEIANAIFSDQLKANLSAINKAYSAGAFIKGEINTKGSSSNQVMAQVSDAAGNIVYHMFKEVGKGFEDFNKFVTEQVPKVQFAMLIDAMRSAGDDYKDLANSIVGDTADLTKHLKKLKGTAVKDLQIIATNMMAYLQQYKDLFAGNLTGEAVVSMSNLVGGIENLQSITSTYYDTVLTEQEKADAALENVRKSFENLGYEMPKTIDDLQKLVNEAVSLGESGNETAISLMKLAQPLKAVLENGNSLTKMLGDLAISMETVAKNANIARGSLAKSALQYEQVYGDASSVKGALKTALEAEFKNLKLNLPESEEAYTQLVERYNKVTSESPTETVVKRMTDILAPIESSFKGFEEIRSLLKDNDLSSSNVEELIAKMSEGQTKNTDYSGLVEQYQKFNSGLMELSAIASSVGKQFDLSTVSAADIGSFISEMAISGATPDQQTLNALYSFANEVKDLYAVPENQAPSTGTTAEILDTFQAFKDKLLGIANMGLDQLDIAKRDSELIIANIIKGHGESVKSINLRSLVAIKEFAKGLDVSNVYGQELINSLSELAPLINTIEEAMKAAKEATLDNIKQINAIGITEDTTTKVARLRKEIQDTFNVSVPSSLVELKAFASTIDPVSENADKLSAALLELGNSMYTTEQDVVTNLISKVQAEYDANVSRLQSAAQVFEGLLDSLQKFRKSLKLSEASILSPEQKYLEAKRQFDEISAKAKSGDQKALQDLEATSNVFLEASRDYYASAEAYAQDFNSVLDVLDSAESIAVKELDVSRAQLDEARRMVAGIEGVKTSVDAVVGSITSLQTAIYALSQAQSAAQAAAQAAQVKPVIPSSQPTVQTPSPSEAFTIQATPQGRLFTAPDGSTSFFNYSTPASEITAFVNSTGNADLMAWNANINGSHADGLNYVPFDGYVAELHKGERVLTAAETRAMDVYGALMDRVMTSSKTEVSSKSEEKTVAVLQAGFNGTIEKLDKVEKRLASLEDQQRKDNL